jgi:hypothetical protein
MRLEGCNHGVSWESSLPADGRSHADQQWTKMTMIDIGDGALDQTEAVPVVAKETTHSGQENRSCGHQAHGLFGGPRLRDQIVFRSFGQSWNEEFHKPSCRESVRKVPISHQTMRGVEPHRQETQNGRWRDFAAIWASGGFRQQSRPVPCSWPEAFEPSRVLADRIAAGKVHSTCRRERQLAVLTFDLPKLEPCTDRNWKVRSRPMVSLALTTDLKRR